MINQFATKWNKVRLTFLDLMNADNLTTLVLETTRVNRTAWKMALGSKELSKSELSFRLKEYELLLSNELHWVNEQLKRLD